MGSVSPRQSRSLLDSVDAHGSVQPIGAHLALMSEIIHVLVLLQTSLHLQPGR